MARPSRHLADDFLDAAGAIVAERGVRAVTVRSITDATGAPSGSLFNRFTSLDELIAHLWLRAVRRAQDAILALSQTDDAVNDGVRAALAVYDFCVESPDDARLLAAIDPRELLEAQPGAELRADLESVNQRLERPFARLLRDVPGSPAAGVLFIALLELPRTFAERSTDPANRDRLAAAVRATLDPGVIHD